MLPAQQPATFVLLSISKRRIFVFGCFFFCFPRKIRYHENHRDESSDDSYEILFNRDLEDIDLFVKNILSVEKNWFKNFEV